jgi:HTH-type transcriptional regulator/antitoxin MqsA
VEEMETNEQCPICGQGHVTSHVQQIEHEYKGHKAMLASHYQECDTCLSEFAGAREGKMSKRGVMAFRKSVDGLLTGAEICALREKYKLTQGQAAKLFGGGPVAFSKYENDDVSQSESMDTLLRLVRRSEAAFWELVEEKGMAAEFSKEKPVVSTSVTSQVIHMADYRNDASRGPNKTTLRPYLSETQKWN